MGGRLRSSVGKRAPKKWIIWGVGWRGFDTKCWGSQDPKSYFLSLKDFWKWNRTTESSIAYRCISMFEKGNRVCFVWSCSERLLIPVRLQRNMCSFGSTSNVVKLHLAGCLRSGVVQARGDYPIFFIVAYGPGPLRFPRNLFRVPRYMSAPLGPALP